VLLANLIFLVVLGSFAAAFYYSPSGSAWVFLRAGAWWVALQNVTRHYLIPDDEPTLGESLRAAFLFYK